MNRLATLLLLVPMLFGACTNQDGPFEVKATDLPVADNATLAAADGLPADGVAVAGGPQETNAPSGDPDPESVATTNSTATVTFDNSTDLKLHGATDYFTIVQIPDTQIYAKYFPAILNSQMTWIKNNVANLNIRAVIGSGDMVENADSTVQWANVVNSYSILDNGGSPVVLYAPTNGNHDVRLQSPPFSLYPYDGTAPFDQSFPFGRFQAYSWYGGHYPSNSNYNSYDTFSVLGRDYIILNIETVQAYLDTGTKEWLNRVLSDNADRQAIISIHGYIDYAGNKLTGVDVDGKTAWNEVVRLHPNVIMVLCGHAFGSWPPSHAPNAGGPPSIVYDSFHCTDVGDGGNVIHNLLVDYQDLPNGGDGYLRYYKIYPTTGIVFAYSYSTSLSTYATDGANQFSFTIGSAGQPR